MIYNTNYIETIKFLKTNIYDCVDVETFKFKASIRQIKKILEYIVSEDKKNNIVSSCITITILAHLLCYFADIKSKIVLGVQVINGKLISHSWLKIDKKDKIINYFTEYENFEIIKEFALEEI